MKILLSTTALVLSLGLPTFLAAQTATDEAVTNNAGTEMPGFLASRDASDVFASELIGHDVYARRTASPAGTMDGSTEMSTMNRADLDGMDNIGQINEIVISADGKVRAIVIGVGGFLGMGEQDVAVTMDQVTFSSDMDDRSEMYVIVNTGAEMLKTSPRYERTAMNGAGTGAAAGTDMQASTDAQAGTTGATSDRTAFVAPQVEREGYEALPVTEMSAEMLVGKSVYGVNDDSVGTIDDLLLDDNGAITNVIIDFGGFLGMGTSQVSVGYDELTILADGGRSDVRVYVDATKEQVQAQPQYRATN